LLPLCRLALIGQRILTWNHTQAAPITKFYVAKYPNVQRGEIPSNFIAAEHLYAPSSSILGKMGLLKASSCKVYKRVEGVIAPPSKGGSCCGTSNAPCGEMVSSAVGKGSVTSSTPC